MPRRRAGDNGTIAAPQSPASPLTAGDAAFEHAGMKMWGMHGWRVFCPEIRTPVRLHAAGKRYRRRSRASRSEAGPSALLRCASLGAGRLQARRYRVREWGMGIREWGAGAGAVMLR